jgi:hypothetical protein
MIACFGLVTLHAWCVNWNVLVKEADLASLAMYSSVVWQLCCKCQPQAAVATYSLEGRHVSKNSPKNVQPKQITSSGATAT